MNHTTLSQNQDYKPHCVHGLSSINFRIKIFKSTMSEKCMCTTARLLTEDGGNTMECEMCTDSSQLLAVLC